MQPEKIVWTWDEYVSRVRQMEEMGMDIHQIVCVLECVTITSDKPMFHISEE